MNEEKVIIWLKREQLNHIARDIWAKPTVINFLVHGLCPKHEQMYFFQNQSLSILDFVLLHVIDNTEMSAHFDVLMANPSIQAYIQQECPNTYLRYCIRQNIQIQWSSYMEMHTGSIINETIILVQDNALECYLSFFENNNVVTSVNGMKSMIENYGAMSFMKMFPSFFRDIESWSKNITSNVCYAAVIEIFGVENFLALSMPNSRGYIPPSFLSFSDASQRTLILHHIEQLDYRLRKALYVFLIDEPNKISQEYHFLYKFRKTYRDMLPPFLVVMFDEVECLIELTGETSQNLLKNICETNAFPTEMVLNL